MEIPRATYRLQFNEHFRLRDALTLVPYFSALGVSHIYSSPLFQARSHSNHGYDVCDFGRINPEIGAESDLEHFAGALHARKMGLILDIVPNHMGIGTMENFWWWEVLKNGRLGEFAGYFDIDWNSPSSPGKIFIPILGDTLKNVLTRRELKLETEGGEFCLCYFEHKFPVAPDSILNDLSLAKLVERQHYILAPHWEGDAKINYRRFFAVSNLAAVRVEQKQIFDAVHALLKKWLERGWVDGLRVDHPDGLREPKKYLDRLRAMAPNKWIVVEKILQPREHLADDWPVQGTTGYDFLNQVNGLFVQRKNEKALTDFYVGFSGEPANSSKIIREKKILVLKSLFVAETSRLTELLAEIAARHLFEKFSREQWRGALVEFAAAFPVYRTFVRPEENFVGKNDFHFIQQAVAGAKALRPDIPPALFNFLSDLLRLKFSGEMENDFIARFQQLTGPVMAKGVEDTVFYCFNRLISLNEVGGDPGKFGAGADEFHEFCRQQLVRWPHTMLGSSTHDTKRSEDVRARINALSEIPGEWRAAVSRWSRMNERHRRNNFPDPNAEYFFYQTLLGVWPISLERMLSCMDKSSREAGQHTGWNNPNRDYDEALKHFITAALTDESFVRDLEKFIAGISDAALMNSLAQTLIKLTAPGVPDIYQGNEIFDFSLVDPDNRRPVDFGLRKNLLAEIQNCSAEEIWNRRGNGSKLWVIQKALALRARRNYLFEESYEPIFARGEKADHIVAFVRGDEAITIVPRFVLAARNNWIRTTVKLPAGKWRDEFSGDAFAGETAAADLFQKFPVALLVKGK